MKIVAVLFSAGPLAREVPSLLDSVENALGLRQFLEEKGHEYIAISDKEAGLDQHLPTTDVLITTPFHPAYVTRERIAKAPKLRLIITAGVGSDHVDLAAARDRGITVAEITGSNVVSVAEHAVMQILILLRNFLGGYKQVIEGRWDIAEVTSKAHDLEGKVVGIVGLGRIGRRTAARLRPFDVTLLYHDPNRLSPAEEQDLGIRYASLNELVEQSDIISIHSPLTPQTDDLFNEQLLVRMKKGAYIVNTARGRIVNRDALVKALKEGHLAGYAGDVWWPQPAPPDHPWRSMPGHAMVPHYSGATLEAQERIAQGVKEVVGSFLEERPIRSDYLIVHDGRIVSPSYALAYAP